MKELQLFAGIVCAIYAVLFGDFLWREVPIGRALPLGTDKRGTVTVFRLLVAVATAASATAAILLIRAGLS